MKKRLGDYIKEYSVRNKGNQDIPVYSVTNTSGFCQDYFGKEVASKDKSTYKIVPRGYFAYNPSRINVGSIDWQRTQERVIVSPLYNVFSVSDKLNCQYLYYYLKSDFALQRIKTVATGSVRDNLKLKMLYEFPINIPDLSVQENIVKILDKVKELEELKKSELNQLDALVKARFVEMFGNPNEINKIANAQIKDVASVKVGIVIKPTQFYSDDKTGKCAFRSLNIIPFGVKKNSEWVYFTDAAMSENKRTIVHKGDLLIVRSGNPGTCCVVPREYDGCNVIDLIIAHPDNSKILPEYLCAFTNMPHGMNQINNQQHGVAQRHFNVSMYEKMKLYVPKLSMQHQFVDFMIRADKSKVAIDHCVILIRKALQSGYHHVWGGLI